MKTKKMKLGIIAALAAILLSFTSAYADDLTYSYDGWEAVGESEVQLRPNIISLENANNQNGITLTGDFKLVTSKRYAAEDYTNGTFDAERNSGVLTYVDSRDDHLWIVYNKTMSIGEHNATGSVTLKWKDAAILADGTLCDVIMIVDNFKFKANRETTKPIGTLYDYKYSDHLGLAAGAWYAQQEWAGSEIPSSGNKYSDIGVTYDITIKVTKSGTDENINKNMVIGFTDLDVPDRTAGTKESPTSSYYEADGTTPAPYAESVTLINGIKDKVYMTNDRYLNISDTTYGSNTKYTATRTTTDPQGSIGKPETKKSGFITRVDSNSFKMNWAGSSCGTGLVGVQLHKVITSTSGDYPDKVTITQTDNEVLWKEDKLVEMIPDAGYSVSKVTVDDEEIDIDTLQKSENKLIYKFNDVTSDHKIDVQVTRNTYTLTVNHVDKNTREAVTNNSSTTVTKYYNDEYNTSPLNSSTTPVLPSGYKSSGTPSNASGRILDNTVVTYEYEKIKGKVITTYIDREANKEIIENNASTKEEATYTYGDEYETTKKAFDDYNYVSDSGNTSGTFLINNENGQINVIYYYTKKKGTVKVSYLEEGTNNRLSETTTKTYSYGDEYETSEASDIPANYTLSRKTDNYRGVISTPNVEVTYYYKKKDAEVDPEITKTGTTKITSTTEKVSYDINYKSEFKDYIGQATITITDKLPYKINTAESELAGGTYNEANNEITWQEVVQVNSYTQSIITITKKLNLKFTNIDPKQRMMTNTVIQNTTTDDKNITTQNVHNTNIEVPGKITVRYVDSTTGEDLIDRIVTTNLVGETYKSEEAEIEGYSLVSKPATEEYEYKVTDQIVEYKYEQIKLKVVTKVNGEGGTIEGDETVLYGKDSTPDKIKIKASEGYIIEKITINNEELSIPEELETMTLSNFLKMTTDKLVEVTFKEKNKVVEVPPTKSNTILIALGTIIIVGLGGAGLYFYNKKKIK